MQDSVIKARIAVLGAGSWGTALAILLARNGYAVTLWGRDSARMAGMAHERRNATYLPDIDFPDGLALSDDLGRLMQQAQHYLLAVPSHAFRHTLEAMRAHAVTVGLLAWATKGFEPGSGKLLSQVVVESWGHEHRTAVISGPTFANEVARNLPTALTVASTNTETAQQVAEWLRSDTVRVYTNPDVAGVQLGGAIKNVMAIAAGISDGLGFGANARAALITRGLAELARLGVAMGGHQETFMGLTGAGDLILTCTDDQSRNRQVGLALGQGRQLPDILAQLGQEAEGVNTARELYELAQRLGVDMPITEQVYRVLYQKLPAKQAVEALLARQSKSE